MMVERKRLRDKSRAAGGDYFPDAARDIQFISTGCSLLDCVVGGGWPLGRIVNIVGDKAVGKTLMAIEAAANFAARYPKGFIWYREAEAAFDEPYAVTLGLPVRRVDFGPDGLGTIWDTVEDIFEDLEVCIAKAAEAGVPGLYIVDSLDALSSRGELARKIDAGSYRMEKPKVLGELFRRLVRKQKASNVCIIFISQVRDKIGIVFGEKHTRSGGKALDFYASLALWLSHIGNLSKTIQGVKRITAVQVRAKVKKNKIGMPFRECEFKIRFGYGVDDLDAAVTWLAEVGQLERIGLKVAGKPQKKIDEEVSKYLAQAAKLPLDEYTILADKVNIELRAAWAEVEDKFKPTRRKYAG